MDIKHFLYNICGCLTSRNPWTRGFQHLEKQCLDSKASPKPADASPQQQGCSVRSCQSYLARQSPYLSTPLLHSRCTSTVAACVDPWAVPMYVVINGIESSGGQVAIFWQYIGAGWQLASASRCCWDFDKPGPQIAEQCSSLPLL